MAEVTSLRGVNSIPTPEQSTDRDLVRLVQHGDEAGFRSLYRRHTPALYPFVLRLVGGDEPAAEDVVQDTWVRAVRGLPSFRWDAAFRTWLHGIALNRVREMVRKQGRRDEIGLPDAPTWTPPAPTAVRVDLERAIASLPDGYRTVLILHDVEGFSHPEISSRLGVAVGTSRSQLFHARKALRAMLEPPQGSPETT